MSSLQRKAYNLPPFGQGPSRGGKRSLAGGKRNYSPVKWDKYFTNYVTVPIKGNLFRVYLLGDSGPVLLLLHGGGYSALTWSLFSVEVSALVRCRIAAIDLRGHGDTTTTDDENLSLEVLASDVQDIAESLYGSEPAPFIVVGHSLGGAVAVEVTSKNLLPSQVGLVVVDVVEGTAIEALTCMQGYLRSRPAGFKSIEHAVEYCIRSNQVRNIESARVSVPGQIKNINTGQTATNDIGVAAPDALPGEIPFDTETTILEEPDREELEEGDEGQAEEELVVVSGANVENVKLCSGRSSAAPIQEGPNKYTWRINLGKTQPHWYEWFTGLSQKFLNQCQSPKLLLLASLDRLDKDITVGHMQGRFQMEVIGQSGHALQEDVPERVADFVASFMVRNRFAMQIGTISSNSPGGELKSTGEVNPWMRF